MKYVAPPWNYLRVRGEYPRPVVTPPFIWELPPRARRIPSSIAQHHSQLGTTSACAENTCDHATVCHARWNYLRVRGEYRCVAVLLTRLWELPPRARRIHTVDYLLGQIIGTTSACAENTGTPAFGKPSTRNYLRVRGEYWMRRFPLSRTRELPPRARRIQLWIISRLGSEGTTSACAENTMPRIPSRG